MVDSDEYMNGGLLNKLSRENTVVCKKGKNDDVVHSKMLAMMCAVVCNLWK